MASPRTVPIRALYDTAGMPLFTKADLRDLGRQLQEKRNAGDKISVKNVLGHTFRFTIQTGAQYPTGVPDQVQVLVKPCIAYSTIQNLIGFGGTPYEYCSLRVSHSAEIRDTRTGKNVQELANPPREELEQLFGTLRTAWENSADCKSLRGTLAWTETPAGIKKIVGLACGTMAYPIFDNSIRKSGYQHALLLTLKKIFELKAGNAASIQCFAQDPVYTEDQASVLQACGIKVLDDPEGFIETDESTVLFSCSPNVPVKQIIADIAQPAVIIWNPVGDVDPVGLTTDPDSRRVCEMVNKFYDRFPFPAEDSDVGDLAVYVRRPSVSLHTLGVFDHEVL